MILVTSNKQKGLLCLTYVQKVSPAELVQARGELIALLAELPPDCRLLADMSHLEYMDLDCAPEMGHSMDLLAQHGVSLIVRVIPDPSKDIGLNILTAFHYPRPPRIINRENLLDGIRALEQWS
jgi:hypothetical protein